MYGMFANKNHPSVGRCNIHGAYGEYIQLTIDFFDDEVPAIGLTGLATKKMALSVTLKVVGTSREYVTTQ